MVGFEEGQTGAKSAVWVVPAHHDMFSVLDVVWLKVFVLQFMFIGSVHQPMPACGDCEYGQRKKDVGTGTKELEFARRRAVSPIFV